MLEAMLGGFLALWSWPVLVLIFLGIVVGAVLGLLPGIGGVVGLALLLPFTFEMEPVAAFALLLATSTVASNFSDITSILFGVPGDGASAALVVDGYPMSKNGEAGRALSANLVASMIGALTGAFALLVAIPLLSPLIRALGSPEFFMLTILGTVFVGTLSRGVMLKGLIAAALGVLLALVGLDPQLSVPRYTFSQLWLWGGVSLIAVALGLFAIPELYELVVRRGSIASRPSAPVSGVWQGIKDVMTHWWLTVRCSLIGTFIGMMPGMGNAVSQWLAYAHAVQSSPQKERFGHGAIEGTLGPGAANNSGLGGSLVTLVAFGIPGGMITAILAGAFLIQGLIPGPSMLTTHLELTMSFVWTIVLTNVIVVVVGLLLVKQIARITYVSSALIVPITTIFVYVGAFAGTANLTNVVLMLAFGGLGIAMVKLGWPRPPLLIGLVLGGLAERYFFISHTRYGVAFFARPLVLTLMLVIVAPIFVRLIAARRASRTPAHTKQQQGDVALRSRISHIGDYCFSVAVFAIGLAALVVASTLPPAARLMPAIVSAVIMALSGLYLILLLWRHLAHGLPRLGVVESDRDEAVTDAVVSSKPLGPLRFAAWLAWSMALVWIAGFVVASFAIAISYARIWNRYHWGGAIALGVALAALVWVLDDVVRVPFPRALVVELGIG